MYEGRTDFEPGRWFGHENLGQVVEVGDGVDKVKVGEYVVLPFNIACGHCKNCERQLTNYCLTAQPEPNMAGAAYGFADMGPYGGGQAELLRVPWGDFNCLRLGEDAERAPDRLRDARRHLPDRLPRHRDGRRAARRPDGHLRRRPGRADGRPLGDHQGRQQGDGRRPAPRPAAAGRVDRRDRHRRLEGRPGAGRPRRDDGAGRGQRLRVRRLPGARARRPGAGQPDDEQAGRARCASPGRSASSASSCPRTPGPATSWRSRASSPSTSACSGSRASTSAAARRRSRSTTGSCATSSPAGKAEPSFIVSHELPLDQAPEAYEHFDNRDDGWTKVVLHPAMTAGA